MLRVTERKIDNQIVYKLQIEDDGKVISSSSIKYQVADVQMDGQRYLFVYDTIMQPIEASYGFLNVFLRDKSINTRYVYMNALKALYCFEAIIGTTLRDFTPTDVELLKDFLRGICRPGETLVFENLTERSGDTVNQYLGVYRHYLAYNHEENKYLTAIGNTHARYRSRINQETSVSQRYKANVKTIVKDEVPRYISVADYTNIIRLIRQKYTMR